jgi:lipopolysaccharide export system permease protein
MKLFDRLLIVAYIKAYVFCLLSLMSLYIVIDLFTNIEDFTSKEPGLLKFLTQVGTWYAYRVVQIFDRLCEAIVLLAGMFTVAWMQRNNELLPMLSAGVSTRRVVLPVLWSACGFLALGMLNQELVIPRIGNYLSFDRDDPDGKKEVAVQGAYEPNKIHIEGMLAWRQEGAVRPFSVTIPESIANGLLHLRAQEAFYMPPSEQHPTGGWLMINTQPPVVDLNRSDILEMIDSGKYFLHTREVNMAVLTRNPRNWYQLLPTLGLLSELGKPDSQRLAAMAVLFHQRLVRPILGLLLIVLGLSVILFDQNRNIFISAALCLILCAAFFGACYGCKYLGDNGTLTPALAAWLPVLVFGPPALVMNDCIHT